MRRTSRSRYYNNPENLSVIPEEGKVKEMTKGEDFYPVTMHDIFARRPQAELIAKVMGADKDFQKLFQQLLKDVSTCTGNRDSMDLWHGWEVSIDEFISLTPYYKSFFTGCTRDSMRMLLLKTRRDIIRLEQSDVKRFKKRKSLSQRNNRYESRRKRTTQREMACAVDDRLTPMDSTFYESFFAVLVHKRLGVQAAQDFPIYLHTELSYTGTERYIVPRVATNRIEFYLKGELCAPRSYRVVYAEWMDRMQVANNLSRLKTLKNVEEGIRKSRKGVR